MYLLTFPFVLGVLRCRKVFLKGNCTADVLEELRLEDSFIISKELLKRTAVSYARISKLLCDFGGGDTLNRYLIV